MNMKKRLAAGLIGVLLAFALTGCSTTVGTNTGIYLRYMKKILGTGSSTQSSSSASVATPATEVAAPESFTVEGDTYKFTGSADAEQYLLYLCEKGSANDDDDFKYSGVVTSTSAAEYTGSIHELTGCAYGEYTAKVFAVAADYSMSKGVLADYSISGELPAPELAYSYDGHGILTLQLANSSAYDSAAMSDEVLVTFSGPVEKTASFDSSLADIEVEGFEPGDYTITTVAKSTVQWVTASESSPFTLAVTLGTEEIASDNYTKPQRGMGEGWEVKPVELTFAEGETGFAFKIGDVDFFHTTAELSDAPAEDAVYTYVLAKGDANAPFDCEMLLNLKSDGTAELTVAAAGPISAARVYGTWATEAGTITVTW